ncbi:MAG: pyridoxal phosphate-dependent aminotransferase [Clostridia bacterium]|nr:pyridoxal phosphate-dependent aminotransferase [Clostridia bacterium]
MKYDFDKIYDRKSTNSLKYDFAAERGKPKDILPLWVADMDFQAPEEVIAEIKQKAEHGIFGYSEPDENYFNALHSWFLNRHGWNTQPHNFVLTCGVVFSICALLRTLTKEGDAVIICQPVYYPFAQSVTDNGRKLVVSELKNDNGYYTVDFENFEKKIIENGVKVFILCNPHNPVGRVWTRDELARMGDICLKHGVFVISDEIHSDFVYGENKHTVFSTVKKEFEKISAICTAPTKTFNIAALHIANTYIYDGEVRKRFIAELDRQGYSQPNIMGLIACQAAYTHGAQWLDSLKNYLDGNIKFIKDYIEDNIPCLSFLPPQGTYLAWIDCRKLNLSDSGLEKLIVEKAGLWLDDGYIFGKGGSGFERINFACPKSTLKTALEKLKKAIETIKS